VSFPLGSYEDATARTGGSVGAVEVKTAWRILDFSAGDRVDRFFVLDARVFVPGSETVTGQDLCFPATLGLVGMHVLHRTTSPENLPQDWMWSTFEHVDNAPLATNAADPAVFQPGPAECDPPSRAGEGFSFFDPACTAPECTPNSPPALVIGDSGYLWETSPPYARRYAIDGRFGTQIVRCFEIFPETEDLNLTFQRQLRGTPFANYRLVNTQWQGGIEDPEVENGNIPRYLGNSVIESYIQSTASCLECHAQAQTTAGQDANFSFLLGLAALPKAE
jgi:hypothetical protein